MILFLAKILIAMLVKFGLKILATLIIAHVIILTLKYLYKTLKEVIGRGMKKVFVGGTNKIIKAIDKEGNNVNIDDLYNELGEEGVIIAEVDQDDEVDEDSIRIIKADSMEESLKRKLNVDEGIVLSA